MAMRIVDKERDRSTCCSCTLRCEDCGKITYRNFLEHNEDIRNQENGEGHLGPKQDSFTHKPVLADFLPVLERSQIKCPRCRIIYRHAHQCTLYGQTKYHTTGGICNHCRLKTQNQKSCETCAEILKILISDDQRSLNNVSVKLLQTLNMSKDYTEISSTKKYKARHRRYSDPDLKNIFDNLRIFKSRSELKLNVQLETEEHIASKEQEASQHEAGIRRLHWERYQSEGFVKEINEEAKYLQISFPDTKHSKGPLPDLENIQKLSLEYDTMHKSKNNNIEKFRMTKKRNIAGILKRTPMLGITPNVKDTTTYNPIQIKRHASHESVLTNISSIANHPLQEDMMYFFPQTIKVDPLKRSVSSLELIHITQEMLRVKDEEIRKKKHEQKISKDEEIRARSDLKKKLKLEKLAKISAKTEYSNDNIEAVRMSEFNKIGRGQSKNTSEKESFEKIPRVLVSEKSSTTNKSPKQKIITKETQKKELDRKSKDVIEPKPKEVRDKERAGPNGERVKAKGNEDVEIKDGYRGNEATEKVTGIKNKETKGAKEPRVKEIGAKDGGTKDYGARDAFAEAKRTKYSEVKDMKGKSIGSKHKGRKNILEENMKDDNLSIKPTRSKDINQENTTAKYSRSKNKEIQDTQTKGTSGKGKLAKDQSMNDDLNDKVDKKADVRYKEESSLNVKTLALSLKEDHRGSIPDLKQDPLSLRTAGEKKLPKGKTSQLQKEAEENKFRQLTEKKTKEIPAAEIKSKREIDDLKNKDQLNESDKNKLEKGMHDLAILELRKNLNQQQKDSQQEEKLKKTLETEQRKIAEATGRKLKDINTLDAKPKQKEKITGAATSAHLKTDKPKDMNNVDLLHNELRISQIKIRRPSPDDLILQLIRLKQSSPEERLKIARTMDPVLIKKHRCHQKRAKNMGCLFCLDSNLELDVDQIEKEESRKIRSPDMIVGEEIVQQVIQHDMNEKVTDMPMLFQTQYEEKDYAFMPTLQIIKEVEQPENKGPPASFNLINSKQPVDSEQTKGIVRYALSDRTFIDKGWTMLPTEKVVRKMNVYRMRPAHPEFDWFEHNKNKKIMSYDSGERLAEFDDNGRGRWYYRNGRLALDYYDAEEVNAQQRVIIYSSGETDERGRAHPISVLAMFDYLGNGVVFDHGGKIRLKYNQTEGVVLDRGIGPVSHWKWHTLNDPPVLQQVMIDTQMPHKDPDIVKLGPADAKTRPDNEDMLAIEFDNFIKEKSKKLTQSFKPFQIKMKALKINENFSLRVLDQATVYLIFRDGTTNLKFNIGMVLDHKEIVDTDTAELGEVSNNLERFPARTDSLAALQRSVAFVQRYERNQTERERRLRPPEPSASADQLTAAASRPMRPPFRTFPKIGTTSSLGSLCKCSRKPSSHNIYYNSRLSS